MKKGNFLIGYAGTTVFANDIIAQKYDYSKPIREFVEDFSNFFIKYRLAIINRILLESLGLDINVFNSNQQNYPPQLQQTVYSELRGFDLGVEFLICGFHENQPRIYHVSRRGVYNTAHSIGYSAIGIGETHVSNFFIVNQFDINKSLIEAIYFAFQAKKSSEIASGVGGLTDISILKKDNKYAPFSDKDDLLVELNKVYQIHREKQQQIYLKNILPKLETLGMERFK